MWPGNEKEAIQGEGMNKRTFDKHLNACRTKDKKSLDIEKVKALPKDIKTQMAMHIIRNRGPVVEEFITDQIDRSWLASMGYMYRTKGSRYTFVHTCEHSIK